MAAILIKLVCLLFIWLLLISSALKFKKHLIQHYPRKQNHSFAQTFPKSRIGYKNIKLVTKGPKQDNKSDSTESNIITVEAMLRTNTAIYPKCPLFCCIPVIYVLTTSNEIEKYRGGNSYQRNNQELTIPGCKIRIYFINFGGEILLDFSLTQSLSSDEECLFWNWGQVVLVWHESKQK